MEATLKESTLDLKADVGRVSIVTNKSAYVEIVEVSARRQSIRELARWRVEHLTHMSKSSTTSSVETKFNISG
jgi:hypothetical protein